MPFNMQGSAAHIGENAVPCCSTFMEMNWRLITSGMHWKSVCVTVYNEEQASLSHQTLFRVTVTSSTGYHQRANVKNLASKSTSRLLRIINIKNFEQSRLVSWRLWLKEKPALDLCSGGLHDNTRKHLTAATSKYHKKKKKWKGWNSLWGEHKWRCNFHRWIQLCCSFRAGIFAFSSITTLDTRLFDAKQSAAFPTYTYIHTTRLPFLHQSLSSLQPGLICCSPTTTLNIFPL